MSSEMRVLIAKWRDLAQKSDSIDLQQKGQIFRWCANDLEALLARTEAGADEKGKNSAEWPLLDRVEFALRDAGFDYDEAFRIAHLAAHPQDASGDAEALQDLMATVRAVAFSGDYGISDEAIAALSDALDDAMQAKEAK